MIAGNQVSYQLGARLLLLLFLLPRSTTPIPLDISHALIFRIEWLVPQCLEARSSCKASISIIASDFTVTDWSDPETSPPASSIPSFIFV